MTTTSRITGLRVSHPQPLGSRHVRRLLAAVAVLGLLFLAGCSSGSTSDGDASSADQVEAPGSAPAESGARSGSEPGATDGADSSARSASASTPAMERSVISTGTVSLQSKDVAQSRRDVQRIIDAQRGLVGEENTDSDDDGATVYARLVLRVPSASFDETMTALEDVATLRGSQRTSEDVTTQVIDTGARVRAQEASLERVEALLARADKLEQIVWIESQLTQRQGELTSLRQQQTWLADQSSLSTITVDIERTPQDEPPEAKKDDDSGFLAGLAGGWNALAGSLKVAATVVGALLPFAVAGAVVGVPLWLVARRRARARTTRTTTGTATDTPAEA